MGQFSKFKYALIHFLSLLVLVSSFSAQAEKLNLSEVLSLELDSKDWEYFHTNQFYKDGGVWFARLKKDPEISAILRSDRGYIYPPEQINYPNKFLSYCQSLATVHKTQATVPSPSICKIETKNNFNKRNKVFFGYMLPASLVEGERGLRYHSVQVFYPDAKKTRALSAIASLEKELVRGRRTQK